MEIDFKSIEQKWQEKWEQSKIFEVDENSDKKKFYVLEMFPYPSGSGLHMGHAWNYTIGDIFARFKIMNQFNVLHPMGYDALGLPAENAAIKSGEKPQEYTDKSIKNFIKQQKSLGISYDWARVVSTANPDYYKWDQWIFLKMFEKNLAYQKTAAVNYCPQCKTVLANEQAQTGYCERCETKVEIKQLKQWFLKITDYADQLLDFNKIDWPERTIAMQKNWIGKSKGTEIEFEINGKPWPIFTTRPDTIFGVTFMVISAQHEKLMDLVTKEQEAEVKKFLKKLNTVSEKQLADMEKQGVFTGSYATNPANNEKVPIYAGNFVVADYGSGMVMAVPAHDQRDFEFAKKYGIEIKQVIQSPKNHDWENRAYTSQGKLINSEQFNNLDNQEAKQEISKWLQEQEKAKQVTNYKLRDWLISRQRYWGTPIPIIHCESCGPVPVPEKDLPVKLPTNVKFGEGNPLETAEDWTNVKCPSCGANAKRETDTMDTFVNSSWYFLRYTDPKNDNQIFNKEKAEYWMPINLYIGGAEHACMHLIYCRFYTKFLRDIGLINFDEPAKKLFHQGMLNAEGGKKMSKSKGNVVLPETVSDKYGIDTARYFLCSLASPDKNIDWDENGIQGSLRFVKKIFSIFESYTQGKDSQETERKINKAIEKVTSNIQELEYRKASIKIKELFEFLEKQETLSKETLEKSLKLLNPICPHITEELWEKLGNKEFLSNAEWPKVDKTKLQSKKSEQDLNEKYTEQINKIIKKVDYDFSKIYVYVIPPEVGKVNKEALEKSLNKEVEIFATNDKNKHDPKNMSKKARPGLVGIYLE